MITFTLIGETTFLQSTVFIGFFLFFLPWQFFKWVLQSFLDDSFEEVAYFNNNPSYSVSNKRSTSLTKRWPPNSDGRVEIPYVIEAFHGNIQQAINTMNNKLKCEGSGQIVGWVPRDKSNPNHHHFVKFVNKDDSR